MSRNWKSFAGAALIALGVFAVTVPQPASAALDANLVDPAQDAFDLETPSPLLARGPRIAVDG